MTNELGETGKLGNISGGSISFQNGSGSKIQEMFRTSNCLRKAMIFSWKVNAFSFLNDPLSYCDTSGTSLRTLRTVEIQVITGFNVISIEKSPIRMWPGTWTNPSLKNMHSRVDSMPYQEIKRMEQQFLFRRLCFYQWSFIKQRTRHNSYEASITIRPPASGQSGYMDNKQTH